MGNLIAVTAAGQETERPGSGGIVCQRAAVSHEQLAGTRRLCCIGVTLKRRLDQVGGNATSRQRLGYPLCAPAAELALVVGISPREPLVVELAGPRQLLDRASIRPAS